MPNGFHIVESRKIADGRKVSFVRIKIDDYRVTLNTVLGSLMRKAWINNFAEQYLQKSFEIRLQGTIQKLSDQFNNITSQSFKQDTGEKVVSESARMTVVDQYGYSDIPLAELFKQKKDGNPGFDFYSENTQDVYALFGEAKYQGNSNAYRNALDQITDFRDGPDQKLIVDLEGLDRFISRDSLNKASDKICGFIAAFSCTAMRTDVLISHIQSNAGYTALKDSEELILIAVEI